MRKAEVYFKDRLAGMLIEDENSYKFQYDKLFLESEYAHSISLTLPLTDSLFSSSILFPFFDGLIPEGWLLDIVQASWKIDRRDRMSLLLTCCRECIGAVGVVEVKS